MGLKINKLKRKLSFFRSCFVFFVLAAQSFVYSDIYDEITKRKCEEQIKDAYNFILKNYVDELDPKVIYQGAIKGMIDAVGDPYTTYLDEEKIRDLQDVMVGSFGGVGLSISKPAESKQGKPAYVEVVSPIEDSPGEKAGIQPGDYITEINGKPTESMSMEEVLSLLRGNIGEKVTVSVLRGKDIRFNAELIREKIEVPSVKYGMIGNTGYLRIIEFTYDAPDRVAEALRVFNQNPDFKNLIIDLRNNPGGLIISAVNIADNFIDEGAIVSTKTRGSSLEYVYKARKETTLIKDIPIVVLVNNGSASASEILSGALKDNHLAYIIGTKTYGKGSVQNVRTIGFGEEIKITVARYYSPSDTNIDKIGIPPDLEVNFPKLTEEDEKNYVSLLESDKISTYVESHPNMSEANIASYAETLKAEYKLDSSLLRKLIRNQVNRTKPASLYDLDYDVQLKAALDLLKDTKDFKKLLESTKTLKQLQLESQSENAENQKDKK